MRWNSPCLWSSHGHYQVQRDLGFEMKLSYFSYSQLIYKTMKLRVYVIKITVTVTRNIFFFLLLYIHVKKVLNNENLQLGGGGINCTSLASDLSSLKDTTFKVGKLSTEERKEKIHRYMKKRNERNFSKKIKVLLPLYFNFSIIIIWWYYYLYVTQNFCYNIFNLLKY